MLIPQELDNLLRYAEGKTILVTGVSHSGKSTLIEMLSVKYPKNRYVELTGDCSIALTKIKCKLITEKYDYIIETRGLMDQSYIIYQVLMLTEDNKYIRVCAFIFDNYMRNEAARPIKAIGYYITPYQLFN